MPLVEEEPPAVFCLEVVISPKSIEFPSDAIVIYSIVFTLG